MGKARVGNIYLKGVTVRFGFDVLEPGKFKLLVKNKATGTPCGVYIDCILNFFCRRSFMEKRSGLLDIYIIVGLSALLVSTKRGNSRALTREASDRDWLHVFFVYVRMVLI